MLYKVSYPVNNESKLTLYLINDLELKQVLMLTLTSNVSALEPSFFKNRSIKFGGMLYKGEHREKEIEKLKL